MEKEKERSHTVSVLHGSELSQNVKLFELMLICKAVIFLLNFTFLVDLLTLIMAKALQKKVHLHFKTNI